MATLASAAFLSVATVLPTVVVFTDGVATARLVGFDGLTDGLAPGHEHEFRTEALQQCGLIA